jgi:hypothetical protein
MPVVAQQEHRWLARLAGHWTYESEMIMAPGEKPALYTGTEQVRLIGELWAVCEGEGPISEGENATTLMTLGYAPDRGRFVGTFVGSMMAYMWIYDGSLDAAGEVLTLESDGPSFTAEGQMGKYKDEITFDGEDRRVMTSRYLADDGEWRLFMTSSYRRAM